MIKTLQKYGNSHALVIDKPLMEAMGITAETPLALSVSGGSLTITAAHTGLGRNRVDQIMDKVERDFGKALTRLSK